jgi:hypothetical protein
MSKKTQRLLNEATVRRFMKYANLETSLVENFMDRVTEDDDDALDDGELEMDGVGPEEMSGEEPMELGMGAEEAPAAPAVDEEVVEDLVTKVVAAITSATGVEVDIQGGAPAEMPAGLEGGDLPAEAEPEMGAELPAEEEEGLPAVGNRNDEEELQEIDMVDDEELTEAVLRRVVERLLKSR